MSESSAEVVHAPLPLRTELTLMSQRTRALLEYYFERHGRQTFQLVSGHEAPDVVIVDLDFADTRAAMLAENWPRQVPCIVLAYGSPPLGDAIMVDKPFDWASLEQAARRVLEPREAPRHDRDDAAQWRHEPAPVESVGEPSAQAVTRQTPPATAPASRPGARQGPATDIEQRARQQARLALLCGPPRSLAELAPVDDPTYRYTPEHYLPAQINAAITARDNDTQALRFALVDVEVYVLCRLERVYLTLSLRRSSNVERVFRRLHPDELQVSTFGSDDLKTLCNQINARARCSFSLEAFTWVSALFAARGRLPVGVSIDQPMLLQHWPNFTRLDTIPACMDIASAWSARTLSVRDVTESVGCEPRFVSAFLNGAWALDLMQEPDESRAQA